MNHSLSSGPSSIPAREATGKMGYATRSLKAALVMRALDVPFSWKSHGPLRYSGRNLVASLGGLGDLILHLPVLQGMVDLARREGRHLDVALRPAHAAIGHACGWPVLALENPLQSVFNGKLSAAVVGEFLSGDFPRLRGGAYGAVVDLTGSVFNALFFKLAGVRCLASRITRGGRGLIDAVIPHVPFENEYAYPAKLAAHLGVEMDPGVYGRLRGADLEKTDAIILGVSTGCRWRNWPVRNHLALARQFPGQRFITVGLEDELVSEDRVALAALHRLENVDSVMNRLDTLALIRLVAGAKGVITNDTALAHIANVYEVPGAVLFGPESSATWAKPGGLRVFHDKTCPYYPCNQWHCLNPAEWCMEKISALQVGTHVAGKLAA